MHRFFFQECPSFFTLSAICGTVVKKQDGLRAQFRVFGKRKWAPGTLDDQAARFGICEIFCKCVISREKDKSTRVVPNLMFLLPEAMSQESLSKM